MHLLQTLVYLLIVPWAKALLPARAWIVVASPRRYDS